MVWQGRVGDHSPYADFGDTPASPRCQLILDVFGSRSGSEPLFMRVGAGCYRQRLVSVTLGISPFLAEAPCSRMRELGCAFGGGHRSRPKNVCPELAFATIPVAREQAYGQVTS